MKQRRKDDVDEQDQTAFQDSLLGFYLFLTLRYARGLCSRGMIENVILVLVIAKPYLLISMVLRESIVPTAIFACRLADFLAFTDIACRGSWNDDQGLHGL